MNKTEKIYFAVTGTVLAYSAYRYIKVTREQKKIRANILSNSQEQLDAIFKAAHTMNERIANGEYCEKTMDDVLIDFDFEIIANRYEK